MESTTINNSIKEVGSFLMNLEVIFLVKKSTELEKKSIKKKLYIIF